MITPLATTIIKCREFWQAIAFALRIACWNPIQSELVFWKSRISCHYVFVLHIWRGVGVSQRNGFASSPSKLLLNLERSQNILLLSAFGIISCHNGIFGNRSDFWRHIEQKLNKKENLTWWGRTCLCGRPWRCARRCSCRRGRNMKANYRPWASSSSSPSSRSPAEEEGTGVPVERVRDEPHWACHRCDHHLWELSLFYSCKDVLYLWFSLNFQHYHTYLSLKIDAKNLPLTFVLKKSVS